MRMLSSKLPSSGATPAAVGNKPSPQDNYEEVEMDIDSDPASPGQSSNYIQLCSLLLVTEGVI